VAERGWALVTGAARRIGRELALTAAQAGYDVVVHHRHADADAAETVGLIEALGRHAVAAAAELAAHPVSAAELGKAAARLESAFWQQLGSSHGRAEALGEFEIAAGDFRGLFARGDEYRRVTAVEVQQAAAAYLTTGARSVVIARPDRGAGP